MPSTTKGSPAPEAWSLALLSVAAAGALFAATAQVAGFDFLLWDDDRILSSLAARDSFPSRLDWLMDPLTTTLTSPVAVGVWGLLADTIGVTPRAFHLLGLLLHAANVALVAVVCRAFLRFTGRDAGAAWTASVCAAALWGLHPVRAEVIGWVAATPYALATALALSSLLAFLGASGDGWRPRARLVTAGILFLLANLAHPYVAPLCLVMFLLDRFYRPENVRHTGAIPWTTSHLPFHGTTFFVSAWSVLMGMILRTGATGEPSEHEVASVSHLVRQLIRVIGFTGDFSLAHAWFRLRTVVVSPAYDAASWRAPAILLGLVALAALAVLARRRAPGAPGLLIALVAHVAFAAPASGPFVERFSLGDRYVYGVTIIATVVGSFLILALLERVRHSAGRALLLAGVLLVSGGEAWALSASLEKWRDTVRLMEDVIATGPGLHWRLAAGLRIAAYWEGRSDVERAQRALRRVVEIPEGTTEERFLRAVSFMVQRGYCAEAAYLVETPADSLPTSTREALRASVPGCFGGGWHR